MATGLDAGARDKKRDAVVKDNDVVSRLFFDLSLCQASKPASPRCCFCYLAPALSRFMSPLDGVEWTGQGKTLAKDALLTCRFQSSTRPCLITHTATQRLDRLHHLANRMSKSNRKPDIPSSLPCPSRETLQSQSRNRHQQPLEPARGRSRSRQWSRKKRDRCCPRPLPRQLLFL